MTTSHAGSGQNASPKIPGGVDPYYLKTLHEQAISHDKDAHDEISIRVYRRLQFRYAQLRKLIRFTKRTLNADNQQALPLAPQAALADSSLAYHLAVTDLFVEKALAYLEGAADAYKRNGQIAYVLALLIVSAGAAGAFIQMWQRVDTDPVNWMRLVANFTRAFTAYGLVVVVSVFLWRYAKAMLDQAERLLERRHALRQGRLFVHLNAGKLTIKQMEKAFNWNASQSNAFGSIRTDVQAPWGAVAAVVAEQLGKVMAEAVKAAVSGAMDAKGDQARGGDSNEVDRNGTPRQPKTPTH